jgi:hypothetical protein
MTQFIEEWRRWMHGEPRVKRDREVSESDLASNNLIVFGDRSSNRVYQKLEKSHLFPVPWGERLIFIKRKMYPAANNLLAMIYPNPFNRERYVVLNSGHTFNANHLKATNALLFPRLPDWAIVDVERDVVVRMGLFGEYWNWE